MLTTSRAFSGFAVRDLEEVKEFYGTKLGLPIVVTPEGLQLHLAGGLVEFVYEKSDHVPATFTILNFPVTDIRATVQEMTEAGIVFERYSGFEMDEQGICWGREAGRGPDIAWFKDPSGNILSVLQ